MSKNCYYLLKLVIWIPSFYFLKKWYEPIRKNKQDEINLIEAEKMFGLENF